MSYIEAAKLVKTYGRGPEAVGAVRGVSFEIEAGEFVAVMGESGSGKSTLLAMMGALNRPTAGRYIVDGLEVYALSADQRADFRREYLGFVFQDFHLVAHLTAMENVMIPLAVLKLPRAQKRTMAREALARVGLAHLTERLPGQLSGGEQERVAIARATVNRPLILLADEPTGNLDTRTSSEVMALLSQLRAEGMTVVMVTHSTQCAGWAERILRMSDGLLVLEGSAVRAAAG